MSRPLENLGLRALRPVRPDALVPLRTEPDYGPARPVALEHLAGSAMQPSLPEQVMLLEVLHDAEPGHLREYRAPFFQGRTVVRPQPV